MVFLPLLTSPLRSRGRENGGVTESLVRIEAKAEAYELMKIIQQSYLDWIPGELFRPFRRHR